MRKHGLVMPHTRLTRRDRMCSHAIKPGEGDACLRLHAGTSAHTRRAAIRRRVPALSRQGAGWRVLARGNVRRARCMVRAFVMHRGRHQAARHARDRLLKWRWHWRRC